MNKKNYFKPVVVTNSFAYLHLESVSLYILGFTSFKMNPSCKCGQHKCFTLINALRLSLVFTWQKNKSTKTADLHFRYLRQNC